MLLTGFPPLVCGIHCKHSWSWDPTERVSKSGHHEVIEDERDQDGWSAVCF